LIDGVEVATDSSGRVPLAHTYDTLNLTNYITSSAPFYGKIKELAVFNEALSNTELTKLTT